MPASLSAAKRSTALPSSNSAFSFSRLSDSPPGVRNRQEIRGTYLTARKWNHSRLLQDSFDLTGEHLRTLRSEFSREGVPLKLQLRSFPQFFLVPFHECEDVPTQPYPRSSSLKLRSLT
ncbi:hypothetical protein VNO80_30640 [Phaseolus coccineus]|uniref:Uncharacterized protein n=1 Tax=Phaseolus coccineus TaxID=3886 RepID=A0AAN9QDN1_PHACN